MKRDHKIIYACGAVLFCTVLAVFFPSLDSVPRIVSDDRVYIGEWTRLDFTLENIIFYFKNPILDLHSPLVMLSFMIDKLVWGKYLSYGAAIGNALLHAVSSVLFFVLLNMLHFYRRGKTSLRITPFFAALAALIWAVHPQRAESVAWACERKDCLVVFFFLAAAVSFICFYRRRKFDIPGSVLLALSFLCKPMLITFPALAAVFVFCETRGRGFWKNLKYVVPYAAVSLLYLVINSTQMGRSAAGTRLAKPELWIDIAANVGRYFGKTFVPCNLTTYYPAELPLSDAWYLVIPALLLPLLWSRSRSFILYCLLPCVVMFGIAVSPVSGVVSIGGSEFADRYSYLPSLFLVTGSAFLLVLLVEKFPRSRTWVIGAAALTAVFSSVEVRLNCELYRDEEKFLESALAADNPHYRILYSYGHRLLLEKRYAEAMALAGAIKAPRGASDFTAHHIDVFRRTLRAVAMIYTGSVDAGLAEFDRVIFSRDCACLKDFSYNFAKDNLALASKLHLQRGNLRHAAHIFGILSDLYGEYDPAERDFYLGVRAMILREYRGAVFYFDRAYKIRPDKRIEMNLQGENSSRN